ncbi:hypothetical protein B0H16DRAFT_1476971 [Mycena metata]|uniref:Uncharacterized protein n=1 Tax=Mycena metata TaxID=1033252 RepID=A0AAD7MG99_9AGAR|nr:hypothetical protein B0H16DRAFT_1476971 [Mycena metata]
MSVEPAGMRVKLFAAVKFRLITTPWEVTREIFLEHCMQGMGVKSFVQQRKVLVQLNKGLWERILADPSFWTRVFVRWGQELMLQIALDWRKRGQIDTLEQIVNRELLLVSLVSTSVRWETLEVDGLGPSARFQVFCALEGAHAPGLRELSVVCVREEDHPEDEDTEHEFGMIFNENRLEKLVALGPGSLDAMLKAVGHTLEELKLDGVEVGWDEVDLTHTRSRMRALKKITLGTVQNPQIVADELEMLVLEAPDTEMCEALTGNSCGLARAAHAEAVLGGGAAGGGKRRFGVCGCTGVRGGETVGSVTQYAEQRLGMGKERLGTVVLQFEQRESDEEMIRELEKVVGEVSWM